MNDDYLWDRTGEPDPEIQQLEEVLGTLRFQPQALELPVGIRPERVRSFRPLAVAAAIAFLILAAGVWLRINRPAVGRQEVASEPPAARQQPTTPVVLGSPSPKLADREIVNLPKKTPDRVIVIKHRKSGSSYDTLANRTKRQTNSVTVPNDDSVAQLNEARAALAAKEQLMLALRLASSKLSLAQRKTQGPPAPGAIRNQHKVG
jgi:hypothetical protein